VINRFNGLLLVAGLSFIYIISRRIVAIFFLLKYFNKKRLLFLPKTDIIRQWKFLQRSNYCYFKKIYSKEAIL